MITYWILHVLFLKKWVTCPQCHGLGLDCVVSGSSCGCWTCQGRGYVKYPTHPETKEEK
jgi:DnaJ-class molecular chaperone